MEIPIVKKDDQDDELNWGSAVDESKNEENDDDDDAEWGDTKNIGNYNPHVWGNTEDDEDNIVEQFFIGDLFIVLLKDKEIPILCNVEFIDENEKTADLVHDTKTYVISYDDDYHIKLKTLEYEIIEIIKARIPKTLPNLFIFSLSPFIN